MGDRAAARRDRPARCDRTGGGRRRHQGRRPAHPGLLHRRGLRGAACVAPRSLGAGVRAGAAVRAAVRRGAAAHRVCRDPRRSEPGGPVRRRPRPAPGLVPVPPAVPGCPAPPARSGRGAGRPRPGRRLVPRAGVPRGRHRAPHHRRGRRRRGRAAAGVVAVVPRARRLEHLQAGRPARARCHPRRPGPVRHAGLGHGHRRRVLPDGPVARRGRGAGRRRTARSDGTT